MNRIERKFKIFLENEAAYDLEFIAGMKAAKGQLIEIPDDYQGEDCVQYLEWDEGYEDGLKFARDMKK